MSAIKVYSTSCEYNESDKVAQDILNRGYEIIAIIPTVQSTFNDKIYIEKVNIMYKTKD